MFGKYYKNLYEKKYNEESTMYIPQLRNNNENYDIKKIYTPRKFDDADEYVIHLENLRKLNEYVNIHSHLNLLENNIYKNIVKKKLKKLDWLNKIKSKKIVENEKLNKLRCKSSLENIEIKTKKIKRCNSSLNYRGLSKINIKKEDVDNIRKELKLPKI